MSQIVFCPLVIKSSSVCPFIPPSFNRSCSVSALRLKVFLFPLTLPSCIVFIWMLFQAKPGTGLDFRIPKRKPRELGSSKKGEQWEMEGYSETKQTQILRVYLRFPCLIFIALPQATVIILARFRGCSLNFS